VQGCGGDGARGDAVGVEIDGGGRHSAVEHSWSEYSDSVDGAGTVDTEILISLTLYRYFFGAFARRRL